MLFLSIFLTEQVGPDRHAPTKEYRCVSWPPRRLGWSEWGCTHYRCCHEVGGYVLVVNRARPRTRLRPPPMTPLIGLRPSGGTCDNRRGHLMSSPRRSERCDAGFMISPPDANFLDELGRSDVVCEWGPGYPGPQRSFFFFLCVCSFLRHLCTQSKKWHKNDLKWPILWKHFKSPEKGPLMPFFMTKRKCNFKWKTKRH